MFRGLLHNPSYCYCNGMEEGYARRRAKFESLAVLGVATVDFGLRDTP